MHYQNLTGLVKVTSVLTPALVNEARISGHRDIGNFDGNTSGISAHQFGMVPLSPLDERADLGGAGQHVGAGEVDGPVDELGAPGTRAHALG